MRPDEFQLCATIKALESAGIEVSMDDNTFMLCDKRVHISVVDCIIRLYQSYNIKERINRHDALEFVNELNKYLPFGVLYFINGTDIGLRIDLFSASPNTLRWSLRDALCLITLFTESLPEALTELSNGHQQALDIFGGKVTAATPDEPTWYRTLQRPTTYMANKIGDEEFSWYEYLVEPLVSGENGIDLALVDDWHEFEEYEDYEDEELEEEPEETPLPPPPPDITPSTRTEKIIVDLGGFNDEAGNGTEDGGETSESGV